MATATKKAAPARPAAKAAAPAATTAEAKAESHDVHADAFDMSNVAREQYDSLVKAFSENAEEFQGRTQELMDAARETIEAAQARLQALNAEAMEAARTEMTEAVDFANELSRAKTVADALEIQRDYWARFFEGRMDRSRALTQASLDAMKESFEPMNRSMASAFAAAPSFAGFFPFGSK